MNTATEMSGNIKIASLLKKSTEKQLERDRRAELEALAKETIGGTIDSGAPNSEVKDYIYKAPQSEKKDCMYALDPKTVSEDYTSEARGSLAKEKSASPEKSIELNASGIKVYQSQPEREESFHQELSYSPK